MASTIILSDNGASSGSAGLKETGGNDGVLILQSTTSGGTATNALYIDNSQNVGLGVTPSAWTSVAGKSLQIYSAANSIWANGAGGLTTSVNATYDGGWKYTNTSGSAARFDCGNGNGTFSWALASGTGKTAGDALSWSTVMTLDASGKLGIGATSPSVRLTVYETSGGDVANFSNTVDADFKINCTSGVTKVGPTSGVLAFQSGSTTERARIDSSGNFKATTTGAYTSGSFHNLVVNNANSYGLIVDNSNATPLSQYNVESRFSASAPNNTSARFFTGQDSSALRFYVNTNGGIGNYSANNVNLSDSREKTNANPAGDYLTKICAIPVRTYNYIDQNLEEDDGLTLGVFAQDVQAVAPELVMESNWGTEEDPKMRLSIYQTDLQYALMKCIQEQQAIIQTLTQRITVLENK